jgi:hypothetical protein
VAPCDPADGALSRRGFLGRAAAASFAAYGVIAGAGGSEAFARPGPKPCRVGCEPISKTGCACGGNLYRCSGCGRNFHACVEGRPYRGFCLRRSC